MKGDTILLFGIDPFLGIVLGLALFSSIVSVFWYILVNTMFQSEEDSKEEILNVSLEDLNEFDTDIDIIHTVNRGKYREPLKKNYNWSFKDSDSYKERKRKGNLTSTGKNPYEDNPEKISSFLDKLKVNGALSPIHIFALFGLIAVLFN